MTTCPSRHNASLQHTRFKLHPALLSHGSGSRVPRGGLEARADGPPPPRDRSPEWRSPAGWSRGRLLAEVPVDIWLFELLNRRLAGPVWDGVAIALTTVGLPLLPALALPLWRRRRPLAMAILFSQGLGLFMGLVLQELIGRTRPEGARLLLGQPSTGSFPSGHALLCVAAATVLWASDLPRRWQVAAAVLAAGVTLSRVAVGHHWPSDVFAGAVLGLGVGLAAHGLLARGEQGLGRARWLLWPQVALVVVISLAAWLGLLRGVALPLSDKSCHFLLFGAVSFWLALGWEAPGRVGGPARGPLRLPLAVALPFALALAEEALQGLSPLRTFDLRDLGCDLAGMVLGWVSARGLWCLSRRYQLEPAPPPPLRPPPKELRERELERDDEDDDEEDEARCFLGRVTVRRPSEAHRG